MELVDYHVWFPGIKDTAMLYINDNRLVWICVVYLFSRSVSGSDLVSETDLATVVVAMTVNGCDLVSEQVKTALVVAVAINGSD